MNRDKPQQHEPTRGEKIVIGILAVIAFAASGTALHRFYVDGGIFGTDSFVAEIAVGVIVICLIAAHWIANGSGKTQRGNKRQ